MMLGLTKDEFDEHMQRMVLNLICDQAAFNIDHREKFNSWREAHSFLLEEMQETEEALKEVKEEVERLWKHVRDDATEEDFTTRMSIILELSVEVVHEGIHIASVAKKALEQFAKEKAPADGNQDGALKK